MTSAASYDECGQLWRVRPAMTSAASYERMVGTYRLDAQILQILYTLANI